MTEIKDFVPLTSTLTAAVRALETERSDRLFEDQFAAGLAGLEGRDFLKPEKKIMSEDGIVYITIRTRFFDDFLMSLVPEFRQIVILGAGMDARAYRLPWTENIHLYELDQPEVLRRKDFILQKTPAKCHRHTIAANLTKSWSDLLVAAGFQIDLPTVWLLEGVLVFLSEAEVNKLLKEISQLSATGSKLGADLPNKQLLQSYQKNFTVGKYWQFGCDEPEELFANYGWQSLVIHPGEENTDFNRFTKKYPPRNISNIERVFWVRAIKSGN
jgi:methyltransferase (TIGR00027 family)